MTLLQQQKRRVILVTDGDMIARQALEQIAKRIGGRCISQSAGNPTPCSGAYLVKLIKETPYDPVLVMFDDCGDVNEGRGERALRYVASHEDIIVLGALAVASNSPSWSKGIRVQVTLDCHGNIVHRGIDKYGAVQRNNPPLIKGDTVNVLHEIDVPIIIGIGDIGKMRKHDRMQLGSPVTSKAIQLILDHHQTSRS